MTLRRFVVAAVTALWMSGAQAQAAASDWATFSRFLSLLQAVMQAAAASCSTTAPCDPNAAQQAIEDVLNGKNPDANVLMLEILADVPPAEREKLLSLGRSMAALARKEAAMQAQSGSDAAAIRARKELTAMGLTYHDAGQFLEAVKRNDVLAARLFLAGRGVNPDAKDIWGNSALDIAKRNGNQEMIALLSAAAAR